MNHLSEFLAHDEEYQINKWRFKLLINDAYPKGLAETVLTEVWRSHPEPHWVKFASGKMFAINQEYSNRFHIELIDYIDRMDRDVWDQNTADMFNVSDKEAIEKRCRVYTNEVVEVDGEKITLAVIKWPVFLTINGKDIVMVAGKCDERTNGR